MIKSLRIKFVAVAMLSTFLVLAVIMGSFNILSYYSIVKEADSMTELIAENDGKVPMSMQRNVPKKSGDKTNDSQENSNSEKINNAQNNNPQNKKTPPRRPSSYNEETPYKTRFFTVTTDAYNNIISTDVNNIAALDEEECKEYATQVLSGTSSKGFKEVYRYYVSNADDEKMLVFLDCRQELESFRQNLLISTAVSVGGLVAVFLLVLFFSKIALKPVEESYNRQKRFISDASHEIKTPLTIIEANTEIIEMENGESKWTESIRNKIYRITHLTGQLVTLTRLDEAESTAGKVEFDLSEAVTEVADSFSGLFEKEEKTLSLNVEKGIRFVGDEKQIRQMLGLFLDNAVKYSIDKDTIEVSLRRNNKKMEILFPSN